MNRNEIVDLLSAAIAYDNRNPTEAQILAWGEAADRARWTYREALDAVHTHYSRSSDYVMPGHITELIKAERNQPPHRPALAPPPPADPDHVATVLDELAGRLGWERGGDHTPAERRAILAVPCSWCRAPAGEPCSRPSERNRAGRERSGTFHPSRVEAAGVSS